MVVTLQQAGCTVDLRICQCVQGEMVHTDNQPALRRHVQKDQDSGRAWVDAAHVELGLRKMAQQVKGLAIKPNDLFISRTHMVERTGSCKLYTQHIKLKIICEPNMVIQLLSTGRQRQVGCL